MCTKRILFFGVFTVLAFCSIVNAAESISSPTKLEAAMMQTNSVVTSEIELGAISTSEANFKVSEISIKTEKGNVLNGIKIYLSNSDGSEDVFLESESVPLLLKELEEIGNCRRYSACDGYFGIARCRPSQSEPQAYCLENYNISNSDFGTLIRTTSGWYKLNQVLPAFLIEVVSRFGNSNNDGT